MKTNTVFGLEGAYVISDPVEKTNYLQYEDKLYDYDKLRNLLILRFQQKTRLSIFADGGEFNFNYWLRLNPDVVKEVMCQLDKPPVRNTMLLKRAEALMNGSAAGRKLLNQKVKDWYAVDYFYDFGTIYDFDPDVTFIGIIRAMTDGKDFYDLINVHDSATREAVFKRLKEILGCSYDDIYSLWLEC